MNKFNAERDAQIEITANAVKKFVRLWQPLFADEPHINFERFMLLWLAQVLEDVGIDAERAD